jgi:hypothetical protein
VNLDLGRPAPAGAYKLSDEAMARLMRELEKRKDK